MNLYRLNFIIKVNNFIIIIEIYFLKESHRFNNYNIYCDFLEKLMFKAIIYLQKLALPKENRYFYMNNKLYDLKRVILKRNF
jgi:hypothetical protein